MDSKGSKTRRYCYTIHNYTVKYLKRFHKLAESLEKHRYICYGLEIAPETGTKHIQGYIELNESQRLTYLHNYFTFQRNGKALKFHIDIANGTAEQNKKYCQKDGHFYEFGEPQNQGTRNDLREIKEAVKQNPKDLNNIIDEYGNNFQQVRYAQIMQPIYLKHRDKNIPPIVYWISGETESGKTRLAVDTFDDICIVSSYDWLGTDYCQQECYLLDDFRPENLPFETLLRITDRYQYTLYLKGGQVPLNSPYIVITTPHCIDKTFEFSKENLTQLKRRVIEINLNNIDDISEVDLRNLDDKFIFNDDDYSHHTF